MTTNKFYAGTVPYDQSGDMPMEYDVVEKHRLIRLGMKWRDALEEIEAYAIERASYNEEARDKSRRDTPWHNSVYGREGERQAYEDMAIKIRSYLP